MAPTKPNSVLVHLEAPVRARAFVVDLLPPERQTVRIRLAEVVVINFSEEPA